MASIGDHADSLFRAAGSALSTILSRSGPASSSPPTPPPTPAHSARSHRVANRDRWLRDSEEASLPLRALTDTFYRLCGETPLPSDCPAFDCIEKDVARTFAGAGQFETQSARDRLRRVLGAYAMSDREVGYVQVGLASALLTLRRALSGMRGAGHEFPRGFCFAPRLQRG